MNCSLSISFPKSISTLFWDNWKYPNQSTHPFLQSRKPSPSQALSMCLFLHQKNYRLFYWHSPGPPSLFLLHASVWKTKLARKTKPFRPFLCCLPEARGWTIWTSRVLQPYNASTLLWWPPMCGMGLAWWVMWVSVVSRSAQEKNQ